MVVVLRVSAEEIDPRVIEVCGRIIRFGGLVAFPTETVYGLGANAFDFQSVVKVFKAKERPLGNPLIVHLYGREQLGEVVREVPDIAELLISRFWPGPLTVVLPKSREVPNIVSGGLDKVGVRVPAHPVAMELIKVSKVPLVAPSANKSGSVSPVSASDVISDIGENIDVVIDSGETYLGIESTVVDLTTSPPTLIRPGSIPVEVIEETIKMKIRVPPEIRGVTRGATPYSRYRHYEVGKKLILVEASNYRDLRLITDTVKELVRKLTSSGARRVAVLATKETEEMYSDLRSEGHEVIVLGPRSNPYVIGRTLFKTLRLVSKMDVDAAIAEGIEERGLGLAIMSRLRHASTDIVRVEK